MISLPFDIPLAPSPSTIGSPPPRLFSGGGLHCYSLERKILPLLGPVCVVSIAGPYRKGKSYILSEAFDQPMVFPLRHEMVAETVGIWLWIVPEKYKVSNNLAFYGKDRKPHKITLIPTFRIKRSI